ncbi:MAG: hypothetical protein WED05_11980 [Candidatus Atabeyarchaeum deiterrae]
MSQKLGFPYLGLGISAIIFLIFGILFATLVPIIYTLLGASSVVLAAWRFIGIFLTGWALLNFMVCKDLLPMQRLIAAFFAFLALVTLFITPPLVYLSFTVT